MIILSFDVGIKNLAYCLFSIANANVDTDSKHFIEIVKWNIIDLSCDHVEDVDTSETVVKISNQCCKCKKAATYCTHSNAMLPEDVMKFCKKHAEEAQLPVHPKLLKSNSKNGRTPYIVPLSIINKKMSCNKINIVDLGKNIKCHLDVIFAEHMDKIDAVLIENQIGNLAGRMNVLQGMISQYFIMRNITSIEFISATNKLKLFKTVVDKKSENINGGNSNLDNVLESEKKLYKMRKDAGKMVCSSLLSFYPTLNEWITKYDKHKKRDDLADCFLQGYYYAHLHSNETNKSAFELDTFLSSFHDVK
jgi:hypothetical protein